MEAGRRGAARVTRGQVPQNGAWRHPVAGVHCHDHWFVGRAQPAGMQHRHDSATGQQPGIANDALAGRPDGDSRRAGEVDAPVADAVWRRRRVETTHNEQLTGQWRLPWCSAGRSRPNECRGCDDRYHQRRQAPQAPDHDRQHLSPRSEMGGSCRRLWMDWRAVDAVEMSSACRVHSPQRPAHVGRLRAPSSSRRCIPFGPQPMLWRDPQGARRKRPPGGLRGTEWACWPLSASRVPDRSARPWLPKSSLCASFSRVAFTSGIRPAGGIPR